MTKCSFIRVFLQSGGDEAAGIFFLRMFKNLLSLTSALWFSVIHNGNAVWNCADNSHIVWNKHIVRLYFPLILLSIFRTWAWIVTSRAEVGSSKTLFRRNNQAAGIAIAETPENSWGYLLRISAGKLTSFNVLMMRFRRSGLIRKVYFQPLPDDLFNVHSKLLVRIQKRFVFVYEFLYFSIY